MALQGKRPHVLPKTQHGKRFCMFLHFFRDIFAAGPPPARMIIGSFLAILFNSISKTPTAGHRRTPKHPAPNNLRALSEHLHLRKPWQVKFKAKGIAVEFEAHAQKLAGPEAEAPMHMH